MESFFRNTNSMRHKEKQIWKLAFFISFSLFVMGCLFNSPSQIIKGLYTYIVTPDILVTDYFVVGSVGAAFVNSSLVMCISLLLMWFSKTPFTGNIISRSMMMAGFALFGKNCINIIPFILGVYVYCKIRNVPMESYIGAALYSCALAPIVSDVATHAPFPFWVRILLGLMVGMLIGYILIPIAEHAFSTHMGYTLFNYGFAGGLLALIIASVVRGIGNHPIATATIWQYGINKKVLLFLFSFCVLLILWGLKQKGNPLLSFFKIMKQSGRTPTDFVVDEGLGATTVNMGIVGIICITYILLIDGDLNGPVVGAILATMGFSASGIHPKNSLPIMMGVFLATFAIARPANSPALQVAAIFGTALAPIAGQFGIFYGIIAGFLHAFLVLTIAEPCGGYNLYNNGFSAGLVALVMVAFIQGFSKKWHHQAEVEIEIEDIQIDVDEQN